MKICLLPIYLSVLLTAMLYTTPSYSTQGNTINSVPPVYPGNPQYTASQYGYHGYPPVDIYAMTRQNPLADPLYWQDPGTYAALSLFDPCYKIANNPNAGQQLERHISEITGIAGGINNLQDSTLNSYMHSVINYCHNNPSALMITAIYDIFSPDLRSAFNGSSNGNGTQTNDNKQTTTSSYSYDPNKQQY